MEQRIITAVKHNELRNGKRTAMYWSISEDITYEEIRAKDLYKYDKIYDHWRHSYIPKRIKDILETADKDKSGFGLKKSQFTLTIKNVDTFGRISFSDVIEIKKATT